MRCRYLVISGFNCIGKSFVKNKTMLTPVSFSDYPPILDNKKKILIVDDEKDICYFLSRSLSKRGFITDTSFSLSEAEKQLNVSTPDILLLDNNLPDGKGIDFFTKINHKYPGLKVIMITAHDSPEDRLKAHKSGIQYFVSKPFSLATINHIIDSEI